MRSLDSSDTDEPCFCSICVLGTYENEHGKRVHGTRQPARTRRNHLLNDEKRKRAATRAANDAQSIESTITLATMSTLDVTPLNARGSMAVDELDRVDPSNISRPSDVAHVGVGVDLDLDLSDFDSMDSLAYLM